MHPLRRVVRPILLSRPALALARLIAPHADIAIEADFESTPAHDTSNRVGRTRELLQHCLVRAKPHEKQAIELWFEDWAEIDQHTLDYAERIFDGHRRLIERHQGPLRGLRILELGPGHTLGPGLLLYANGAASYTAADLFPLATQTSAIYRRLRRRIAQTPVLVQVTAIEESRRETLRRYDEAVDTTGETAIFDATKVEWKCPADASSLPFANESFDVVISNAAFEHFMDPAAAVNECARLLAPNGVGIHQIDFRDHREGARPLDFLSYEDAEWKRLNADMVCYTNRLRQSDFEALFSKAGLTIEVMEPNLRHSLDPGCRERIHPRFRDRTSEDLEVLSALFVVRKSR